VVYLAFKKNFDALRLFKQAIQIFEVNGCQKEVTQIKEKIQQIEKAKETQSKGTEKK